ncbi:hypothetical protein ACQPXB_22570 [Amycolatopsis sp. CA-161197]|uniref:hypothetical protein n=1 Tax=Amycolatopsis sp. CA-161197 TaxID=3239922 RepID=UPI003D8A3104
MKLTSCNVFGSPPPRKTTLAGMKAFTVSRGAMLAALLLTAGCAASPASARSPTPKSTAGLTSPDVAQQQSIRGWKHPSRPRPRDRRLRRPHQPTACLLAAGVAFGGDPFRNVLPDLANRRQPELDRHPAPGVLVGFEGGARQREVEVGVVGAYAVTAGVGYQGMG